MPYESPTPPIDLPTDVPLWDFFFGPTSVVSRTLPSQIGAFIDATTNATISFHELRAQTTHLSTALTKHYGLKPGETVALFSTNTIYYPVALFGTLHAGGVVSGASPAYTVEEMAYALKTAAARFLFTLPGSIAVAVEAAQKVGMARECVFLLDGKMDGFTTLQELVARGAAEERQVESFKLPKGKVNGEVCGFLSFSSGTTGLPKAVMISHQNVIAQCLQLIPATSKNMARVIAALPLFHITGLIHLLHLPLLINATVFMLPVFTLPALLTAVCTHRIPEILVVPPILIRFIRDPIVANYDLTHVKRLSSGAAPLSREVILELARLFPWMGMKHGYGMTESCSCITITALGEEAIGNAHTVGRVCASTLLKIVDEAGKELPQGEQGELWASGPQVVMGYLRNEKATNETFVTIDGRRWLKTGDVAMVDRDGRIVITDRIKEMIKVNGVQVAPAELEDLLLGHEKVEDVAVLGVPHDTMGEVPRAFVVLKERFRDKPQKEVEEQLVEYVKRSKGVRTKWLRGGVRFVESVPKSPSGKILRRVLREQGNQELQEKLKAKL